jgi:hypothetical protein
MTSVEQLLFARDTAGTIFSVCGDCWEQLRGANPEDDGIVDFVTMQTDRMDEMHRQALNALFPNGLLENIDYAVAVESLPPFLIDDEPFATAHQAAVWVSSRCSIHKQLEEWIDDARQRAKEICRLAKSLPVLDVTVARIRLIEEWKCAAKHISTGATESQSALTGEEFRVQSEREIPPDYRDGGLPNGAPLTTDLLEIPEKYNLSGSYLTKNYSGPTMKWGRKKVYRHAEIAALSDQKSRRNDR